MTILKQASLLMLPSGYKEDKLYSINPVDGSGDLSFARSSSGTRVNEQGLIETASVLGSESIVNGDFATDSDWIKGTGWSIGGGVASANNAPDAERLRQNGVFVVGKIYKVTYEITEISQGGFRGYIGGTNLITRNTVGVHTQTLVAPLNNVFYIRTIGTTSGSIDNVSAKEVITNNVPRIDYTGGCGKLLIEPQSTNLLPYSEQLNQLILLQGAVVSSQIYESPAGDNSACLVDLSGGSSARAVENKGNNAIEYTLSAYLRKHENDADGTFPIAYYDGSDYQKTYLSLTSNWQRFSITFTNPSSGPIGYGFSRRGSTGLETLTRAYAWGMQIEESEIPTSYIPTSGTTVTRTQDTSLSTSSNIAAAINDAEGVLFIDFNRLGLDFENSYIGLYHSPNSYDNHIRIIYRKDRIMAFVRNRFGYQAIMYYYGTWTMPRIKIAFKYKVDDFALWVNGVEGVTDTSGSTFDIYRELDTINLGDQFLRPTTAPKFNARINAIAVYDTAISDADLAELTTL